jgi:hypothetical protein
MISEGENKCSAVTHEVEHKDKLNILLESKVYELLSNDPTAKFESKVQKLLSKYKAVHPNDLKCNLPLQTSTFMWSS